MKMKECLQVGFLYQPYCSDTAWSLWLAELQLESCLWLSGIFYQGPAHRLEVAPPDSDKMPSILHLSDLSTDEEDIVCCRMNEYEKKIDSLINAVGMMKEVRR